MFEKNTGWSRCAAPTKPADAGFVPECGSRHENLIFEVPSGGWTKAKKVCPISARNFDEIANQRRLPAFASARTKNIICDTRTAIADSTARSRHVRFVPLCGRLRVGKDFFHACRIGRCARVFGLSARFT